MRATVLAVGLGAALVLLAAPPAGAVKRVPYPQVSVIALPVFEGDPALDEMRKRFATAVAEKNLNAVVALLAPNFDWTAGGIQVDDFDQKRGAEHNFKVAFGFRAVGGNADGTTEIGPQWDLLAFFASDPVLTKEKDAAVVCGSTTAKVADLGILDAAFNRLDEDDDLSEWVYSTGELDLTSKPEGGENVAKTKSAALPIVGLHPALKEGDKQPPAPTHFELLLPSGQTGWTPVNRVRPLLVDRMCFSKSGKDWKIAVYDQAE